MLKKLSHVTILVKNQNDALEFYTKKLGFKVHTDAEFGEMRWLTIHPAQQPDMEFALMLVTKKEDLAHVGKQGEPYSFGAFETDDCRKTYKELKEKGVECLSEPQEESWGIGFVFKDLYGTMFYVSQHKQ